MVVKPAEELGEVAAGELPLERPCHGFVVLLKVEQALLELGE